MEADIPARGLATIPNFAYFHDSLALFKALSRYARSVLRAFYGAPGKASAALAGDAQLQAFLGDLAPGKQGGMHNFPHPAAVNNVGALARIVAQVRCACCDVPCCAMLHLEACSPGLQEPHD